MFLEKYDYDLDIQAKQEEAYRHGVQTGIQQGINQGVRQKALETAKNFLQMNLLTSEQIAQGTGLTLEQILEIKQSTINK